MSHRKHRLVREPKFGNTARYANRLSSDQIAFLAKGFTLIPVCISEIMSRFRIAFQYILQNEIIRVFAETEKHIHSQYEDLLTGLVRLSDGSIGTLTITWLTPTKIREFIVTGKRNMFRC